MSRTLRIDNGERQARRRGVMSAVVADTLPLWHRAVESVLTSLGVDTVGTASMPSDGISLIERYHPDILVTDLDFGGGLVEGAAFIREALRVRPGLRVVVLTMHKDMALVTVAIEAGAAAYAMKTVRPDDLGAAIRQTFEQSIFLALAPRAGGAEEADPAISSDSEPGAISSSRAVEEPDDGLRELTKREREILRLVAQGHANAVIAQKLWVTEQTVKFHLSNVYRKLGVSNRTQASQCFHRQHSPEDPAVGA